MYIIIICIIYVNTVQPTVYIYTLTGQIPESISELFKRLFEWILKLSLVVKRILVTCKYISCNACMHNEADISSIHGQRDVKYR